MFKIKSLKNEGLLDYYPNGCKGSGRPCRCGGWLPHETYTIDDVEIAVKLTDDVSCSNNFLMQ